MVFYKANKTRRLVDFFFFLTSLSFDVWGLVREDDWENRKKSDSSFDMDGGELAHTRHLTDNNCF